MAQRLPEENFVITEEPLQIEQVVNKVKHPHAGAISTFIGTVRELTRGRRTLYLHYEAYVPMAQKQLRQIGEEIINKWPEARVAISHRIGRLDISDLAVVIAVSTPHRADAFEAARMPLNGLNRLCPSGKKSIGKMGKPGLAISWNK